MLRDDYATWQCGSHEISLSRPRVMGVLNVTPDSFSDGGANATTERAVTRALTMLDEGADIIDVGGESTRPGHEAVTPEVEAARIVPVIRGILASVPDAVVSIDTRHASVARLAMRLGACIINDVTGFTSDEMLDVAADTSCGCVVTHWQQGEAEPSRRSVQLETAKPARRVATSARRFTLPDEASVMREVMGFLGDQARALMRVGVSRNRICVDPGPGFDKTADEDVVIQRATRKLVSMGYPVLCATSRKRFVGRLAGVEQPVRRDAATVGTVLAAIGSGARIVRVHNVAAAAQAIDAYWACTRKDPRQAFVSLGSNVGDRLRYLARAVQLINALPMTCVVAVSHAYETEPAYGIETPVANAVAEIRSELHPLVLMDCLLDVEHRLGRKREGGEHGAGPRTIDCDLCWVEGEAHAGAHLTLPHPGLGEREYVLVPMEDLMHDPVRFLTHAGVPIVEPERRVGYVIDDLGPIEWE